MEQVFEVWKFRGFLANVVVRDIKARHRKTVLGLAWTMLSPLLTMTILAVLFAGVFGASLKAGSFPLYVISGLLLWNLFSSGSTLGLASMTSGASIIRKVYVPKAIFPLAAISSSYITFALSLLPMLILMFAVGAPLTWSLLLALIPTVELAAFTFGVSLVLSTLNVFFRDVKWFYESALLAGFYTTPIFYTPEIVGEEYLKVLRMNPLWPMLRAFRDPIVNGVPPTLSDLAAGGVASLVSLILGWLVFRRYERELINYL